MAKNFRKGERGQKTGKRSNEDQKQNQNQKSNPRPGSKSEASSVRGGRSSRDAEEGTGGSGNSFANKKSRSKRPIKNARSLSDVLSGKKTGSAPSPQNPHRQNRSGAPGRAGIGPSRPTANTSRMDTSTSDASGKAEKPKSAMSKMLTYIMSFTPPGASKTPEPPPEAPPSEKIGMSWPKNRTKSAVDVASTTEESARRRSSRAGGHLVQGVVKRHPDGYGFLIPDDTAHADVYISRQSMNGVMTNDRVEAEVYKQKPSSRGGGRSGEGRSGSGKDDRLSGEIVRVLSRANKTLVGKFLPVDQKYGVIQDDGRGWGADLRIATKDSMDAQEGQMVAAEVLHYPGPNTQFTGRVVGIIGDMDNPINDVIRVIHQSGIPNEFSSAAVNEARKFGGEVTPQEERGREDLTKLNLITIDGATAKDFDDAIFTEQTAKGFHLIVAIADVSHYVKPGTPLDQEAYERGTSTYFPNFVVPMLPEELSNELCSLKPSVKRLCFVCDMQINFNGDVTEYDFYEGVMESKARVTYGQAQEVMDSSAERIENASAMRSANVEKLKNVEENILRSADLAKILMAKRFREGSLDLEIPETHVVVDSSGETTDVIKSERLFAHRLIEELMLVTNICTARFMEEKAIPGIYRVHEEPDPDNLEALQRYLWNFGGSKSVMGANLQKKLSKALAAMEGKPEAQILNILTLRTMRQAHYSQDNVGHFGLGFSQYSHFTSPIRRYPDLIAHRLIKSQIYPKYKAMAMTEEDIASATTFLSACEQRSTKAERKVVSIKKARFMKKFVGQEFEGVISSVAKFGVFVLLRQFDVDGLVKVEKLGNDRFMFDDQNLRLIGTRTGLRYAIGDTIRVVVTGADAEAGKIDFELTADVLAQNGSVDSDDDDFVDKNDSGSRPKEPNGGAFENGRSKKGRSQKNKQNESKAGSKKRLGVHGGGEERGKTKNNSRGVRKERVSKRRGKN